VVEIFKKVFDMPMGIPTPFIPHSTPLTTGTGHTTYSTYSSYYPNSYIAQKCYTLTWIAYFNAICGKPLTLYAGKG